MSFSGVDFLGIEDMLSDDEKAVRDLVRDFVDDEVLPIIEECAYEGRFPKELIPQMAAMNLFGSTIPSTACPGLNNVAYGLIMQELERGDSGLRSFVSVQSALVMYPIYTYGSKAQKDRWIPRAREGRGDRLLRPDGAGLRIEPGRDADGREEGRQGLGPERRQGVDHERLHRGRRRRLGEGREHGRPDPRLPRREGHARVHGARAPDEDVPARVRHVAARASRTARFRRTNVLPGVEGIKGPLCLPHAGALRDRLGRDRLGHGDLHLRARLREVARSSSRTGRSRPTSSSRQKLAFMITEITKGQLLRAAPRPDEGREAR